MAIITCENCRKRYDNKKDDFCPKCGAFNQPQHRWREDSYGNVVRVDGVNEANHQESFVHQEVHREKAQRRQVGLDWRASSRPAVGRPSPARPAAGRQTRQKNAGMARAIAIVVGAIILVNFIIPLLMALFSIF